MPRQRGTRKKVPLTRLRQFLPAIEHARELTKREAARMAERFEPTGLRQALGTRNELGQLRELIGGGDA